MEIEIEIDSENYMIIDNPAQLIHYRTVSAAPKAQQVDKRF